MISFIVAFISYIFVSQYLVCLLYITSNEFLSYNWSGKLWKSLSSIDRQPFYEEEKRLRKLHSEEHPNYIFRFIKSCDSYYVLELIINPGHFKHHIFVIIALLGYILNQNYFVHRLILIPLYCQAVCSNITIIIRIHLIGAIYTCLTVTSWH